jgi:hypothetical protein
LRRLSILLEIRRGNARGRLTFVRPTMCEITRFKQG